MRAFDADFRSEFDVGSYENHVLPGFTNGLGNAHIPAGHSRVNLIGSHIYVPGSHQAAVHFDVSWSRLLLGSANTGKTLLACAEALFHSRFIRVNRGLYLTNNVVSAVSKIDEFLRGVPDWVHADYRGEDGPCVRFVIQDREDRPSILEVCDWCAFSMEYMCSMNLGWLILENPPAWWGMSNHIRAGQRLRRLVPYRGILYIIDFREFYEHVWVSGVCNSIHQFSGVYSLSHTERDELALHETVYRHFTPSTFIETGEKSVLGQRPAAKASDAEVSALVEQIDTLLEGELEVEDLDALPKSVPSLNP